MRSFSKLEKKESRLTSLYFLTPKSQTNLSDLKTQKQSWQYKQIKESQKDLNKQHFWKCNNERVLGITVAEHHKP